MTATHANPLIVDHLTGRPCLDLGRFAIGTIVDADTTAQTRTRSYTVRVAVTSTVLIPVTARSESDAEEQVDRDEVRAYLDLDEIVWSVVRAELTD